MVLTRDEIIPPPRRTAQVLQELINNRKQIKAREYERNRRQLTSYEFLENASKPLANVLKGMFEDINTWDIKKLKDGKVGWAKLSWENIEAILGQLNRMDKNEAVEILAEVANKLPNALTEQKELVNKLGALFAQTPQHQNVTITKLNELDLLAPASATPQPGSMGAYRRRTGRFGGISPRAQSLMSPGAAPPPESGAEPTAQSERLPRGVSVIQNLRRQYGDAVLGFAGELLKIGSIGDIDAAVREGQSLAVEGISPEQVDNLQQSEIGRIILRSMESYRDSQGYNGEAARHRALDDIKLLHTAKQIAQSLQGHPHEISELINLSEGVSSSQGAASAASAEDSIPSQYEVPLNPALGLSDDYFGEPEFGETPPDSPASLPKRGNVAIPNASAPMMRSPMQTGQMERLLELKVAPPSAPPVGGMPEQLYGIMSRRPPAFESEEALQQRVNQEAFHVWRAALDLGEDSWAVANRRGIDTTELDSDLENYGETMESQEAKVADNILKGDYPLKDTLIDLFSFKYYSVKKMAETIVDLVEGSVKMDKPPQYELIKEIAEGKRNPRDLKEIMGIEIPEHVTWGDRDSSESTRDSSESSTVDSAAAGSPVMGGQPVGIGDTLGNMTRSDYLVTAIDEDGTVHLSFRDGTRTSEISPPYGGRWRIVSKATAPIQGDSLREAIRGAATIDSAGTVHRGSGMGDGRFTPVPNKKWNPLKLSADGHLGDINVDLKKLLEHMELVVKKRKGGKVMMRKKGVPMDLIRLLTRRYNPKSKYSDDAKDVYRKIINLAKVPLGQSYSSKEHIMGTGIKLPVQSEEQTIIDSVQPEDVLQKLMVSLGTWKNGNRSNIVKNKISSYADMLLKQNIIDKQEHKLLHDLIQRGNKALTPELNEFINEIFS